MLLILASRIVSLGATSKDQFDSTLDTIIRETLAQPLAAKSIKNQRTEMVRPFGLVKYSEGLALPGNRLSILSQTQDIPRFFKSFCMRFQFPGGFVKPDRVSEMVAAGVHFKPAQYILTLLKNGESRFGNDFAISAAEMAHFVFNDKRVTVSNESTNNVLTRIVDNRTSGGGIDKTSDVIRYARDFLNYMVEGNLLDELKGMYRLNGGEQRAIHSIIADKSFFGGYSKVIKSDGKWDVEEYKQVDQAWMEYFADAQDDEALETPVSALIKTNANLPDEWERIREMLKHKNTSAKRAILKELGDEGERIAFDYERGEVAKARKDLLHLVKVVSSNGTLGYDILSLQPEQNRRKKFIEVKTTKKNYESDVVIPFFMSINEWSAAEQLGDDYYIYRVIITREKVTIFSIKNPVLQYKNGHLRIEATAYKIVYSTEAGTSINIK